MINHKSKLICPHCSHEKTITMPSTFCQYFLECTNCKTVIKAKAGDCCVLFLWNIIVLNSKKLSSGMLLTTSNLIAKCLQDYLLFINVYTSVFYNFYCQK